MLASYAARSGPSSTLLHSAQAAAVTFAEVQATHATPAQTQTFDARTMYMFITGRASSSPRSGPTLGLGLGLVYTDKQTDRQTYKHAKTPTWNPFMCEHITGITGTASLRNSISVMWRADGHVTCHVICHTQVTVMHRRYNGVYSCRRQDL